ncbi:MAG: metallophosphoesterase family protein [Deltaproteobacteria bacterium]|jgi:putative phosphoesterase|nr:metallophosphoesterase family protein [Deltaproteobacteria bacterium]MBW2533035.1 metallophosphoesterase family protein [Deltaproteobacteria bacterium]
MVRRRHKPQATHQSETVTLAESGPQRLVVVSDTHGRPHPASAGRIAAQRPAAILHAGDFGSPEVLDRLRELAPLIAVRGNVDGGTPTLPDSADVTVTGHGCQPLKLLLTHIAVYGPKLNAVVARRAAALRASLVVCGHSHVPFIGRDRGLLIFNPGSLGPRRFQLPITFGVIELGPKEIDLRHIDCETGDPWMP